MENQHWSASSGRERGKEGDDQRPGESSDHHGCRPDLAECHVLQGGLEQCKPERISAYCILEWGLFRGPEFEGMHLYKVVTMLASKEILYIYTILYSLEKNTHALAELEQD